MANLGKLAVLIVALLAVSACATPREPAGDRLKLIDLTGEVARAWAETAALPDAERVTAFKARMEGRPGVQKAMTEEKLH